MYILLIDDDANLILETYQKDFDAENIRVDYCTQKDEAIDLLHLNYKYDAIILDWYLEANDSTISKLLLKHFEKTFFIPVFIWSQHIEDYKASMDEGEISYPKNLIYEYSKLEKGDKSIGQILREWVENNFSAQISHLYRKALSHNFERVLFELNELQNVDLAKVLTKIYGDGNNVDWSNDVVLNLIHRSLISDAAFIERITKILEDASGINAGASAEDRRKIANKLLYYRSKSNLIRNGDIVVIKKMSDESIVSYGIVITPDCDLEQSGSRFINLIELLKFGDEKLNFNAAARDKIKNYNHDSFYLFQSLFIQDTFIDFVAVLKSRIILEETAEVYHQNYPKASKRLLYSQEFIFNNETVKLELLCSKVNPYKAEFLQKLHASNSRVGIPDIKDLL